MAMPAQAEHDGKLGRTNLLRQRSRPRRPKVLGLAMLLVSLALAGASPSAQAVESLTHERPNAVVTTTCSSVTIAYRDFPNATNNTVTEIISVAGAVQLTKSFSFNGPSGTDLIPISTTLGHTKVDAHSKWDTNGFKGSFDVAAGLTCRTYLTGRAFGLSAQAAPLGLPLIDIPPTPDTGPILTSSAGSTSTPCVLTISGLISAEALCVNVTTTLRPPKSTAKATAAELAIAGLLPLPSIAATLVEADSTSTCAGSSGRTVFASLSIGLSTLLDYEPPANTTIELPLGVGKIVLNEQLPVAGADHGLTVNAIHITVPALGIDVIVSSATSDIHHC